MSRSFAAGNAALSLARDEGPEDLVDRLSGHVAGRADHCVLRVQRDVNLSTAIENDRLLHSRSGGSGGALALFCSGGLRGVASRPDQSDITLDRLLREAGDNLTCLTARQRTPAGNPAGAGRRSIADHRSRRPTLGPTERVAFLRALHARLGSRYRDLRNIVTILDQLGTERGVATSQGDCSYSANSRLSISTGLTVETARGSCRMFETKTYFGTFEDNVELIPLDLSTSVDRLYEDIRHKIEGIHPDSGLYDVVMCAGLSGVLAHEAVGHPAEADHVLAGSRLANAIGRQIAAEKITLVDQGRRGFDGNAQTVFAVDDEGTPCSDVVLVQAGILVDYLHNTETAGLFGTTPSGNARAGTYADCPLIRMRNTAIQPGTDRLETMIESIDHGYLLRRPGPAQADLNCEFSIGVEMGYEIRHGRIGRAIKDTVLTGNAFDVLGEVTHVGDDFAWLGGAWCAKGQTLAVSMGGPSLRTKARLGGR
jgi:TldD protein